MHRVFIGLFIAAIALPLILPERPASVPQSVASVAPKAPVEAAAPAQPSLGELVTALDQWVPASVSNQHTCLAQAIYFEARSEPIEGQLAVAHVVLNRVKDPRYPNTICGVVFQNEHRRHRCQFSFACDGLSDNAKEFEAWRQAMLVGYAAAAGYWEDLTQSATHYHATYVDPAWRTQLVATAQFGRHLFYQDHSF